ncbi:acyl transferase/acyl hydrolase/lysophospholipase [Rhexocercosporidium sp. MPI-PUGE-AT-0058]|nr:acyl transferase/acyl hydrolase/lysophospholipase [Rhexocercosporidium sp. MPI-PUGE-AT-0058]
MSCPQNTNGSTSGQPDLQSSLSKSHDPPSRNLFVADSFSSPDRTLCRSPVLSSLPEDEVSDHVGAAQNATGITDFALPIRQDTGSTSSISDTSYLARSNRSSIAGHNFQPLQSQNSSENALHVVRQRAADFEAFKNTLKSTHAPISKGTPRAPTIADFNSVPELKSSVSLEIRTYNSGGVDCGVANVVIFLDDGGGTESTWKPFAKQHLGHPQTVLVFLSGIIWTDEELCGNNFQMATRLIMEFVVQGILVEKCNFRPNNIALIGQGQGGTAALTMACAWSRTILGGIVSVDGPLPEYITRQVSVVKIPTPILLMGGKLGALTPQADRKIQDLFLHVDTHLQTEIQVLQLDALTVSEDSRFVADFLDHALRHEEWVTQAVLTFDGGGIRGYGSLLVMRELMRHIGAEERRLDSRTTSSFYPGIYKPTNIKPAEDSRPPTVDRRSSSIFATSTESLEDADLFLPCHYFTYVGGTSTGGLISIMLSRFRMSVNDCISEYKSLGERVFAHPRQLSTGGLLWHKFGWRPLEDAIKGVTSRYCSTQRPFGVRFPSDPDFCRTVVLAYSENGTTDAPYLFRTYETFARNRNGQEPRPGVPRRRTTMALKHANVHNPGAPSDVEIHDVGRATSAAPTKFPPVRITITDSNGTRTSVRFKDGGFGSNNPSCEVYKDVIHKHGGLSKNVSIFVSVGTGKKEVRMFAEEGYTRAATRIREFIANIKAILRHPSRTEGAHEQMLGYAFRDNKPVFPYYRLDGGVRLGNVKMDEWKSDRLVNMMKLKHTESGSKTLHEVEEAVTVYLASDPIQKELRDCARLLVQRRRLRVRDKYRWDRYASASWYECPYVTCKDAAELKTFAQFESHIRGEHNHDHTASGSSMEEVAENSRRCWLYTKHPDYQAQTI